MEAERKGVRKGCAERYGIGTDSEKEMETKSESVHKKRARDR